LASHRHIKPALREDQNQVTNEQGKVWLSVLPQTLQTFLDQRGFPRPRFP